MTDDRRMFARTAGLSLAAIGLALVGAAVAFTGHARWGALSGVATAGATGVLALVLVRRNLAKPLKDLMGAILATFLVRMILVGVGLAVLVKAVSAETALPYAVAFFGLFFVLQALELVYATRAARTGGVRT